MKRFASQPPWMMWVIVFAGVLIYKYIFGMEWIFGIFSKLGAILKPFVIGFIIAYIVNIPAKKIEVFVKKYTFIKNKSYITSVIITYILFLLVFVLAGTLLTPVFQESITKLVKNAPDYYQRLTVFLQRFDGFGLTNYISGFIEEIQSYMTFSNIGSYMKNIAHFTGSVADVFIAIIVSVYTLVFKTQLKEQMSAFSNAFVSHKVSEMGSKYANITNDVFSKYIASQGIDAIVIMILSVIIMAVMKVEYALVLGVIIGICNMIPYIGAFVSIFLAVGLTLMTGGLVQAIWLLVLLIVLQQLDANFISVKIVGESLSLNPLEVIFAIALGGGFFGGIGMFFAVPFFAAAKEVLSDILKSRMEKIDTESTD